MLLSSFKLRSARPLFCQARLLNTSVTATTFWGHGVDADTTSKDSVLGVPTTDLKNLPTRKALRAMDRLIPCLSIPETPPSYNHPNLDINPAAVEVMIPSDKTPKGLVFDENWLDAALDHVFNDPSSGPSFGENVPDFDPNLWPSYSYSYLVRSRENVRQMFSITEWMTYEIAPSSNIHHSSRWRLPGQRGSFKAALERYPTRKPLLALEAGFATRDFRLTFENNEPIELRQIWELPTMIELVKSLELEKTKQGKGKLIQTTDFAIPNLLKEAYFSSVSDNVVIWIGHPALYTVGYSRNGYLYLSGWRSPNPERIAAMLDDSTPISLAEFTAETLAMAILTPPPKFDAFLEKDHRPPSIPIAHLDTWVSHLVSKTARAVQNLPLTRVVLGGVDVYGHWTEESELPDLSTTALRSFPNIVRIDLNLPKTWENTFATAKIVSSKALQVQRELQGIEGIPTLYGSLEVTVADPSAHGTAYPFYVAITANVGPTVESMVEGNEAWSELIGDEFYDIDAEIRKILRAMHERGWHHHYVNDETTLQDKDGKVYLTDFGSSMRAEECNPAEKRCDDRCILAEGGSLTTNDDDC